MVHQFPFYRQLESADCGSSCLRIVSKFYGKKHPANYLRDLCHTTQQGVSLLSISDAAEAIGFRTSGLMLTWKQLRDEAKIPCIAHWNQHHFIVVYKVSKKHVWVSDPAVGLIKYSTEKFQKYWLSATDRDGQQRGTVLLLEPTPEFYEIDEKETKNLGFMYLLRYMKSYKRYIFQIILGLLTGGFLSLILPFISQAIVDEGIGTGNLNFVVVMLIAQVMIIIGSTANNLIQSWLMLHMTARLSVSLISDFLHKLMRLPIAFFDSRRIGDILQRIGDYGRVQSFLTGSLLSITMALFTLIVYGGIMMSYNLKILLIFVLGSVLYVSWVLIFVRTRRKLDYKRFQASANNQSNMVQLVSAMQEIKLNHCEKQKRWEWERIQAKLFKINISALALGQAQSIGGMFIDQTKNVIISFLAAQAVINGDMTLGMMTAVQYVIGQLNAPVSEFISFIQSTQDAKISLERLNEIYSRDEEEPSEKELIKDIPHDVTLELRHVSFQYEGKHSEMVLEDINLIIPSNKVTAIVGTSGSGKTTLLKMLLGFYPPSEGEILLNGRRLQKYSPSSWRDKCGVVMQEGFIFSDTIANNIAVGDETPDMKRLMEAATAVRMDSFIESLPLGYKTKVGIEGQGLSSGQKQRILIARAIYKQADMLILDEATNSLDAHNEKYIMNELKNIFKDKTVIVVAHRLSTVKDADNIIVLENGILKESGNHESLIQKKGSYYKLIKNQLELGN